MGHQVILKDEDRIVDRSVRGVSKEWSDLRIGMANEDCNNGYRFLFVTSNDSSVLRRGYGVLHVIQ